MYSTYCTLHDSYQMKLCGTSYSEPWDHEGEQEREPGRLEWLGGLSITRGSLSLCRFSDRIIGHAPLPSQWDSPGDGECIPAGWLSAEGELNWTHWEMKGLFHRVIQSSLFARKIWADCLQTKHVTITTYKCSFIRNRWDDPEDHLYVIIKNKIIILEIGSGVNCNVLSTVTTESIN